jgi:flavodoxin long chain
MLQRIPDAVARTNLYLSIFMTSIGLFYNSTTGSCETVARLIRDELKPWPCTLHDIFHDAPDQLQAYPVILFGIASWETSKLQNEWRTFVSQIKPEHVEQKTIAIFGLGDQQTFTDSFVDEMGLLYEHLIQFDVNVIGTTHTAGYSFNHSKAARNNKFVGLAIDEDTQYTQTGSRVKNWVAQLKQELNGIYNR